MKRNILTLLLSVFIVFVAKGQKEAELTAFVEKVLKSVEVVPGLSVAVANSEGTLYARGFGKSNLDRGDAADSSTNFYIASSTKPFNGLLATLLAEEGEIDLNREILTYQPFSNFERRDIFEGITVQDLLSHTSGIDNPYLSFKLAFSGDYSEPGIVELVETGTVLNEEGKVFNYTNFGYYLFDLLLDAELGEDWRDLLDKRIFTPAGMTKTTAYVSETPNHAAPHVGLFPESVKTAQFKTDKTMHAAGGLMLNAEDAARFLTMYLNNGTVGGKQVVPANVIKQSYQGVVQQNDDEDRTFTRAEYANGWNIGQYEDDKVIFHFGGYTGFAAHLSFMPEQNIGVAVFANHDIGLPVINLIASYAYDLYNGHADRLKKHMQEAEKELPKTLQRAQKRHQQHIDKLNSREWDLRLPREAYVGKFKNDNIGAMEVAQTNDSFEVTCGNMSTLATPFPAPNCLRVELVPGSGTIIQFLPHEERADTLNWQGELFVRVRE